MPDPDRIEAVRRFNRFYTRRIGVLNEGLLDSPFNLTEGRILFELAHLENGEGLTATDLGRLLDLDGGYLSRLLRDLKERDLVRATRSAVDARQSLLQLSPAGRKAFKPLERRSQEQVGELLDQLGEAQQTELLQAFRRVQGLLEAPDDKPAKQGFILRPHRPGDMGWIVSRHGALYARDYQFDQRFEALVARIAADFIERFDARREACWIAERDGVNIGSVALVQARDEATDAPIDGVAQLRLLLVEPAARGLGLGDRLVAECHRFARDAGYQRVRLWTNSQLDAAKHIYRKAGYRHVGTEPFQGFGLDLVGETWELDLQATA
ncbi:bifunctional helix-turn-helix transcriptional regulator/GNAT family N-acetyltransferase [Roseateles chitinivorans]|uniref:bifunctional helix-turn-helix transcriptional regulator/GNAT family N-acetyltransferase n=1 Tax=Roseateles chitinivorans TaxID=2917965 RepID=UPI003D666337